MAPLLPYLLAYVSGILATVFAEGNSGFPVLASMLIASTGILAGRWAKPIRWQKASGLLALFVFGVLAPSLPKYFQPADHILLHLKEGQPARVHGQLIRPPVHLDDRTHYIIKLESVVYQNKPIEVSGTARITWFFRQHNGDSNNLALQVGDRVRWKKIRLKRPRNFKNPGRFDYERFMQSRGIDVTGSLSRQEQITRLGNSPLPLFSRLQTRMQESFSNSLDKLFPGTEGSMLKAMLLGEKQYLSKDIREDYFATGLAHLMAVSGLHIGFVAAAAYFLIWPAAIHGLFRMKPQWALAGYARTLTACLCMVPVLYYMILAGPKISALRAGIMVILGLFAILAHRLKNMFNALLLAAFLILLQDPLAITDVSFQLSFTATLAILLVISQFTKTPQDPVDQMGDQSWWNKCLKGPSPQREDYSSGLWYLWDCTLRYFFYGAIISFSAVLSTMPILIFHFHQISLAGFFLNLLMVPLASLLIPLALLVISAGIVAPFFAGLIAHPVLILVKIFLWVPQTFADLPFTSLYIATPYWSWFILYYMMFVLTIILAGNQSLLDRFKQSVLLQAGAGIAMAGLILWLAFPRFAELPNEELKVTFLDVGQGESIWIEFPNRQTLLIDGGGFYKNIFDVGRYVVAPFLWRQGIQNIDYMAVTHSDNDHIRGLESLIQLFPVGNFFDPPAEIRDSRIDKLRAKMLKNNAGLLPLRTGESLTVGEVRLTPLHPGPGFTVDNDNDRSLVLRLEYKDFKLLLTGDISEKAEQILLDSGAPLQADFLKSPHHGSRFSNSPAFIEAVSPKAVFFSSGYLNRMHHPHPETLKRFQEQGSTSWRTDLQGAIQISTDGHRHQIKTHADL